MVTACAVVLACVGIERLVELGLSTRHAAWSFARGGIEFGQDHLMAMKVLHTAFLLGCVYETYVTGGHWQRQLGPIWIGLALSAQALRYWCILTLGQRWNIRVIVVPDLAPVVRGPYRFFRHPNYVAVCLEGIALPMVFGAWRTALIFTCLNAVLLRRRIACENQAIAKICGPYVFDAQLS